MYFNYKLFCITALASLALLFIQPGPSQAQLTLVDTPTGLSSPRYGVQAVYDGQDSIYFTGGLAYSEFLKYSLTTGTVAVIGSARGLIYGGMAWAGNGQIYYFGGSFGLGGVGKAEIWKIQITKDTNGEERAEMTQVNSFPAPQIMSAAVWDEGNAIYIMGGSNNEMEDLDTIFQYEIASNTLTLVNRLDRPRWTLQGVFDGRAGTTYVFGDLTNKIIKYEPYPGDVTTLGTVLPTSLLEGCPVLARQRTGEAEIFLMGFTRELPIDETRNASGIVWFSPKSRLMAPIAVANWPYGLSGMGCVYVPKLNRIYLIGGAHNATGEAAWSDRISYIDLSGYVDPLQA